MLARIGEPIANASRYELDHRIPLALGGARVDRRNLALQPIGEARRKDAIEFCLYRAVCDGAVTLTDARLAIWTNWRRAGRQCFAGESP